MEAIRDWILSICIAAVAASIVKIIAPSGGIQRTMKVISAVFMLCIIISPLIGEVSFNFEKELDKVQIPSRSEFSESIEEQTDIYTKAQLQKLMETYLQKEGIERARISIIMERDEDSRISIIKADVYVEDEFLHLTEKAKQNIEKELGIEIMFYSYNGS